MKKILLIAVIFFSVSVTCSYGQNNEYMPPKKYMWGDYRMEPMTTTDNGTAMYLGIKNIKTGGWIYRPLDRVLSWNEYRFQHLLKVNGNFYSPFYWNLVFLTEVQGYHPDFDGLVWSVPDNLGALNSNQVYSGELERWLPFFSGLFKIENDRLVPVLTIAEEGADVLAIKGAPFVILSKSVIKENNKKKSKKQIKQEEENKIASAKLSVNTKTGAVQKAVSYVYDTSFKLVDSLDGSVELIKGDVADQIKIHYNNGTEALLDPETLGILKIEKLVEGADGLWGIENKNGGVMIPCILDKKSADRAFSQRRYWSYTMYCERFVKIKSDFETKAEYEARLNDPDLQAKYIESKGLEKKFMQNLRIILGRYDAETETFPIYGSILVQRSSGTSYTSIPWNDFRLKVPRTEAEAFQNEWNSMVGPALAGAKLGIRYDTAAVFDITFTTSEGKSYSWHRE